jgi:hypothetical protein
MADAPQTRETDWTVVIGSSLAFLCLHYAEMRNKTLLEQAGFLERLGMPLGQAATLLGSTERSLKELARQRAKSAEEAKKSKGTKA